MYVWNCINVDENKANELSQETGISKRLSKILVNRGIDSKASFSSSISNITLCNPYDLKDMSSAVERIESALNNHEKICIYGDYDADGVTSTALLMLYFQKKKADVIYYIPDRIKEGYGLNNAAIKSIHEKGVSLIITVDNGISAIKEAEYISGLNMDLVVTDHHRVGNQLPECCAVVDPHRQDSNTHFKDWCGVGVAFKLICALEGKKLLLQKVLKDIPGGIRRGFSNDASPVDFGQDTTQMDLLLEYADIIALGTIGDVVSLTDENRIIVKTGLEKINAQNNLNVGIQTLISQSGVSFPLSATDVAFYVVPKLNAVGRLNSAAEAVELLISSSETQAVSHSSNILGYNQSRKDLTQKIIDEIEEYIVSNPACLNERVLIFSSSNWHSGIIGIAAAHFVNKYGKPCLVITIDGDEAKGSGRSVEGFSLFDCILNCSELLTHYGGHPLAAGFSLHSEDISEFSSAVLEYAKTVSMPFPILDIDSSLDTIDVSIDFLDEIETLEPFGKDNQQPVFALNNQRLKSIQYIGKNKNHAKLFFENLPTYILKFNMSEETCQYLPGDLLDIAVTLSRNEYNGAVSVNLISKDIHFSSIDYQLLFRSIRGYEQFLRGEPVSANQAKYILPSRDLISSVFKLLANNQRCVFEYDTLSARFKDNGSHICKILASIDILTELDLVSKEQNRYIINKTNKKKDLNDSSILQKLNSMV